MKPSQHAGQKRFYKSAGIGEREDGTFAVLLDGRQVDEQAILCARQPNALPKQSPPSGPHKGRPLCTPASRLQNSPTPPSTPLPQEKATLRTIS